MTDAYTIDDGYNRLGTRSQVHVSGSSVVSQKTYDAQPHLDYAAKARELTRGQRWGDGKLIGHIPAPQYAQFLMIRDNQDRQKAIKAWLHENTKLVMFERFLLK